MSAINPLAKILGLEIQRRRTEGFGFRGWIYSRAELAKETGMTVNRIASIERGEVDIRFSELLKIADALHMPIEKLIEGASDIGQLILRSFSSL